MWFTLAVFGALLLALVFMPLGVEVSSMAGRRKWYLILAGFHLPVPVSVICHIDKRMSDRSQKPAKRAGRSAWSNLAGKLRGIRSKGDAPSGEFGLEDLRAVLDLVVRVLRVVRLRVHRLHILIATPDPALTGIAYGMACAVIGVLPSNAAVSVDVDWTSTVPETTYRAEVSVIPWRLLSVITSTFWKKVHQ